MSKRIICIDKKDEMVCFYDNNDKLFVLSFDSPLLDCKTFPCPHCGEEHTVKEFIQIGEDMLCPDCFDEADYFKCDSCGEYHQIEELEEMDGRSLCKDCFHREYFICDNCGAIEPKSECTYVGDGAYCQDCVDQLLNEGEFIVCARCDEVLPAEDAYEFDGDYYCRSCYDEVTEEEYGNSIVDYHCNRPFRFKSLASNVDYPKKGNLYLGLEHELSGVGYHNYELASSLVNNYNRICEHDSSINNGFEVISDALTFAYWKKHEDLQGYMDTINRLSDFDPDDSSGIHVHISRGPLSDNAVIEMAWFVMQHYDDCIKFGRRDPDECEYCERVMRSDKEDLWDYATGHGVAVNLEHSSNLELRFFKTTDDVDHLWAILEFSYALAMVAKGGVIDIEWSDIRKFCEEDGNEEHFLSELNNGFDCEENEYYDYELTDYFA